MRIVIADCSVDYEGRLSAHLPEATREAVTRRGGSPRLRFLDYDWRLNDRASPEARPVP